MPKAEMGEADLDTKEIRQTIEVEIRLGGDARISPELAFGLINEIERLREALEKIRDEPTSRMMTMFIMRDIARAALHTENGLGFKRDSEKSSQQRDAT